MCTPQLRAQNASLQGVANPKPSAAGTGGGGPPMVDPMRRRMLALSPVMATRGLVPTVSGPTSAASAPVQFVGVNPDQGAKPFGSPSGDSRSVRTSSTGSVAGMLNNDIFSNTARKPVAPNPASPPAAQNAPDSYDERHAPTPAVLAEVVRDAKVRTPFEVTQPARSPFIYSRDYRTTPRERAWLAEVEQKLGEGRPYPDGSSGQSVYDAGNRARERILAGYLYTLPEGKAFLDVLSTTEGTVKDGYFTTHDGSPPAESLAQFARRGRQGRYQFLSQNNDEIINAQMGRKDFGEVTQDIAALRLLIRFGAMQKLMHGDLQGAFTAASRAYASLPISQTQDYSGFTQSGKWEDTGKDVPRQRRKPFAELPKLFLARLNARRTEFREAKRNWREKGQMPWAFISPYRQPFFGRDAFKPSR